LLLLNEWMTTDLVTVPQETHLDVCARIMARDSIRHLPVVDGEGRLRGVVHDVALFALEMMYEPEATTPDPATMVEAQLPASFVAVPPDIVAGPNAPMLSVVRRLAASRDDAVIAIDKAYRPLGIFTEHDVVVRAASRLRPSLTTDWSGERRLISVQVDQPLSTALAKMEAARVRHLLVYEGEQLAGVISLRDLAYNNIRVAAAVSEEGHRIQIGELLRVRPFTAPSGTPLRHIAGLMQEQSIGCVPIVEGVRVKRVITRSDITRALAVSLEDEVFFDGGDVMRLSPMLD